LRNSTNKLGALIVIALLLTSAPARATDAPLECTTNGEGNWNVTATGPLDIECPFGGDCTAVQYVITPTTGKSPDHVVVLADHDVDVLVPESRNVSPPCVGDNVTAIGTHNCSTSAVRMNANVETGAFDLIVSGKKELVGSSIVIKKGKVTESCRIASLGAEPLDAFDPNAQRTESQTISFKGCMVNIPTDPMTGEGGVATITGENCVFVANAEPVSVGELIVNGSSVGTLTFGEGNLSSGVASCTSKVINRKLYTWCDCDDVNGDGIPEDPSPPCPATVPIN